MLRSYFAAAVRNLLRNRLTSAINIGGLALGFAAAILIGLYLRYQLTFEQFLPGHDQVYRLSVTVTRPGNAPDVMDGADFFMAEHLRLDYPEVARTARLVGLFAGVRHGDLEFHENVYAADPDFFRMMPFPVLSGDLATALDSPDGIVITRGIARKYFGRDDVLGETLDINRTSTLRILAVIEDLPGNTHFNFRMIASARAKFTHLEFFDHASEHPDLFVPGAHTYFQLRAGASTAHLRADANNFLQRHYAKPLGNMARLDIYPLMRVHLSPPGRWPISPVVNPRTLWALAGVGLLVIFIAVFNFVSLMTARAAQRAVEIGVRKSAGARRRDLVVQFLGESVLYVCAAVLLAMALVELVLPTFNSMLGTGDELYQPATVTFPYWRDPMLAGTLALAALVVSVLAGAYPALVMAAMRPINALHHDTRPAGAARLRSALVILQLAIMISLIFVTAVIHRQTAFALNAALRVDHDQVLLLFLSDSSPTEAFKESFARIPGVSGVTAAAAAPTNYSIAAADFSHAGSTPTFLQVAAIDFNFFEFFRLQPLAGRLPSRAHATDRFSGDDPGRDASVWLNESAVRALGIASPTAAVGERLTPRWHSQGTQPATITIAGVIPDFPVDSVRGPIQPAVYFVDPDFTRIVSIRLRGGQIPQTLAAIDALWRRIGEPRPVSRLFLDQYYNRLYIDIIQQRRVLGALCAVAVFLAALGLFGLSIYTVQRRTREIGIRKAMGASTRDILQLLLWAFSKPVLWASVIAWPVSAWLMQRWLEGFAYRVPLGWWWLPLSTLIALGIALFTVSVHSVIAARARPEAALRHE